MTKQILHAIKKFLRVGVVAVTVTSGSINASAQKNISDLSMVNSSSQFDLLLDGSEEALIDQAREVFQLEKKENEFNQ